MSEARKLRVFLCHSLQDKPAVRELYRKLTAEGWIEPWLDEEELLPGQDWDLEIERALDASDAVIVCLSNNSVTKEGYVQHELRVVLNIADYKPEGTLFILPVRLDDCPLPRRLKMWQYVDLFPEDRLEKAHARLRRSLELRATALGIGLGIIAREAARRDEATADEAVGRAKAIPIAIEEKHRRQAAAAEAPRRAKAIRTTTQAAKPKSPPDRLTLAGIEFCRVPAGRFLMGSLDDDKQAGHNEKPQHLVDIPYDYWMARFPVTNGEYAVFVKPTSMSYNYPGWEKRNDHPVTPLGWNEAMAYCSWLNERNGNLPQGLVLRLPTEAEWEKAARGLDGRIYPWGNQFDQRRANVVKGFLNGFVRPWRSYNTTPVTKYSPQGDSPYGCADMSGNAWEWTDSLYRDYPYRANDRREDEQSRVTSRVTRGGSCDDEAPEARAACRRDHAYAGFRVALAPPLA